MNKKNYSQLDYSPHLLQPPSFLITTLVSYKKAITITKLANVLRRHNYYKIMHLHHTKKIFYEEFLLEVEK